jgi:hypothetical protein
MLQNNKYISVVNVRGKGEDRRREERKEYSEKHFMQAAHYVNFFA